MRRENSSCVSPRRFRTRCANSAASWAAAASSIFCCSLRSASDVLSSLDMITRPPGIDCTTASSLKRTVFIVIHLAQIGLAGRNDADGSATHRKHHMEYPPLHLAQHLQSLLAVFVPMIGANHSFRIQESVGHICKVKAPMLQTLVAFDFIPFKIHRLDCRPLNYQRCSRRLGLNEAARTVANYCSDPRKLAGVVPHQNHPGIRGGHIA